MKNKKWFLLAVAVVLVFVFVEAYLFWWPAYVLSQKIGELKNDGVNVVELAYFEFQVEATSRTPPPVFVESFNWNGFVQQVLAIKTQNGTATVFVDSTARVLWFYGNSTTRAYIFYYQA